MLWSDFSLRVKARDLSRKCRPTHTSGHALVSLRAADADARVLGVMGRAFAPGSGRGRRATLPAWLAVGGGGAPHHAAGAAAA
eukprot:SAG11_NODE_20861_length_436_cov_28.373887_1_plen_82_part_10